MAGAQEALWDRRLETLTASVSLLLERRFVPVWLSCSPVLAFALLRKQERLHDLDLERLCVASRCSVRGRSFLGGQAGERALVVEVERNEACPLV